MKRIRALSMIGVAALMLGACGNDVTGNSPDSDGPDRTAQDQAYIDNVTASMETSYGEDAAFPNDQMECFVGGMVDGVGVDKLENAGITADTFSDGAEPTDVQKLSKADRTVIADSFVECVDLESVFTESIATQMGDGGLSDEMTDCFDGIDWETMERAFAEDIVSGESDTESAGLAPLTDCVMLAMGDAINTSSGDDNTPVDDGSADVQGFDEGGYVLKDSAR